jgi:hypothetical protein
MSTRMGVNQRTVTVIDEIFLRVVWDELREGYRGYALRACGVRMCEGQNGLWCMIDMFMHDSPLKPKDAMRVNDDFDRDADVEMIALNAVLSMKRLIDLAYEQPDKVPEMTFNFGGDT